MSQPENSESINQMVNEENNDSNEEGGSRRKKIPKDILQCCFIME